MKKIKAFLKRHTAALLLLAVVLTMSVGTLWAKYAMDVKVTDSLSLTVEAEEEYAFDMEKSSVMENPASSEETVSTAALEPTEELPQEIEQTEEAGALDDGNS